MSNTVRCPEADEVPLFAVGALSPQERSTREAHLKSCGQCQRELDVLTSVVGQFRDWPQDVMKPSEPLWEKVARRIGHPGATAPAAPWTDPGWEQAAPGIACKLLATDTERNRVSMLVRLDPKTNYPPHLHAGVEELHLLEGELWIDDRLLHPGDYNRAEPGTSDARVYSETGCTCVLITSPGDVLR